MIAHVSPLDEDDFPNRYCSDAKEHVPTFPELIDLVADDILDEDESSHELHSDAKEHDSKSLELIHLNAEHNPPLQLSCKADSSNEKCYDLEIMDSDHLNEEGKDDAVQSQIELATSLKGEVKISVICNSPLRSNFHIPSLDAVFKAVEEKCLRSYRITDPSFSLLKVMKDVCECFLAAGTITTDGEQVSPMNVPPTLDVMKKSNQLAVSDGRLDTKGNFCIPSNFSIGSVKFQVKPHIPRFQVANVFNYITSLKGNGDGYAGSPITTEGYGSKNSSSMEIVQKQGTSPELLNASYYVDDITRGEEILKISLVNEINNECQPTFYYIPKNITYRNAYVKFLLARISDENCCSNCIGDCTSLEIPCACAGETGGEFAYTPQGLVKDDFLQKCLSMNQNHQQNLFYCKDCPLQRFTDNRFSNTCNGHIVRKFIKECWYKCGCSKNCGNRVVQRGITANLQVFMTPEGKGWGLRTLEDLPKGTFICEYVGEIVTNTELDERNKRSTGERHTYPVLLDADWGSEGVLKDEEALCLDATSYGNVARFINHRCRDANMVEIPVEVETPDHHYYHLAFFTAREVNALEELTWDYGIDFGDTSHPVKAFQCRCGSKFCKFKRRKRSRSSY